MSPRFAGFSRELALEENLAKRVMEERRANATIVFHHPCSGGSMEKIVPKGDFSIIYTPATINAKIPN